MGPAKGSQWATMRGWCQREEEPWWPDSQRCVLFFAFQIHVSPFTHGSKYTRVGVWRFDSWTPEQLISSDSVYIKVDRNLDTAKKNTTLLKNYNL